VLARETRATIAGGGQGGQLVARTKSGSFTMNLRIYWPKAQMLDGCWTLPPVKRVN
jgi:hypothetical protein